MLRGMFCFDIKIKIYVFFKDFIILCDSYTPEAIRPSAQRHTSTSSTSSKNWADRIEQFEKDKERALKDMMRYKRRLLMSESSDCSNEDQENQ